METEINERPKVTEFDCATKEVTERYMTDEEYEDHLKLVQLEAENSAKQEAEAQAQAEAKASANAKLAALGLSETEIAAILGK